MKRVLIVTLVVASIIVLLSMSTITIAGVNADKEWKLGDRVVPGPLPPDSKAELPSLTKQIDITYGDHELQKLDFYKPTVCSDQKVPLAVYIHGGGFTAGDKKGLSTRNPMLIMFSQLGFATASLNYRLVPEVKMPVPIEDCKLAIRYLRAHADELGFDSDRIALWGSSAGGHLVNILCTADDDDGLEGEGYLEYSSGVSAVAGWFGSNDLTTMFDQIDEHRATLKMERLFGKSSLTECYDQAYSVSPIAYVSEDDPPLLILHGDLDDVVPYAQATQMAKAMYDANASCALIRVDNAKHGFRPAKKDIPIEPSIEWIHLLTVEHLSRYLEPELTGDLNMDGKKDVYDVLIFATVFGTQGTDSEGNPAPDYWNPLADIEPDGRIDIKDWEALTELF